MTIELNIATVVYICSCVGIVGGAVKILYEAKKALTRPLEEVNRRFEHYDACLERDKRHLQEVDETIAEIGTAVNLLVSANRTMLAHLKDNNHNGEIDKELKKIDQWLVDRKDYTL